MSNAAEMAGKKICASKGALPVVLLIVGVLGGLFGRLFIATQAGAVGALLSMGVAALHGRLNFAVLRSASIDTLSPCSSLFIVTICTSMLTRFLTLSDVGYMISDAVDWIGVSPVLLLIVIALVYMCWACFSNPSGKC